MEGTISLSRLASQHAAGSLGRQGAVPAVAAPESDDRFDLLVKYIPTETITLFVAAMSAHEALGVSPWTLYLCGAFLTPVIFLLAAYGKQRVAQLPSPSPFRPDPWPVFASLAAFLIWALSVPDLLTDAKEKIAAAFGAVLVSTLLALLEPALSRRS